jgi:hypothetical protein
MSTPERIRHALQQELVATVGVRLASVKEIPRCRSLLRRHRYLGGLCPVEMASASAWMFSAKKTAAACASRTAWASAVTIRLRAS